MEPGTELGMEPGMEPGTEQGTEAPSTGACGPSCGRRRAGVHGRTEPASALSPSRPAWALSPVPWRSLTFHPSGLIHGGAGRSPPAPGRGSSAGRCGGRAAPCR